MQTAIIIYPHLIEHRPTDDRTKKKKERKGGRTDVLTNEDGRELVGCTVITHIE